jgi:hypothetical protein
VARYAHMCTQARMHARYAIPACAEQGIHRLTPPRTTA